MLTTVSTHVRGLRLAHLVTRVALATFLTVTTASAATAHAQLVSIDPPDGARLEKSPDKVVVTFDEPVGLATGGLRVIDASGAVVDAGDDIVDGPSVRQTMPPLAAGWYVITWGIVSEDGHVVRASSVFAVGDEDAAPLVVAAQAAWSVPLVGVLRASTDLAVLVAAGAWAAWWLLRARTTRVRLLGTLAAGVAIIASGVWLVAQWQDGGDAWFRTPAALAGVLRIVCLSIALASARQWPAVATGATMLALLSLVGGGHTAGSPITALLLVTHLMAAMVWLGAAPAVLLVLTDRSVDDAPAHLVVRRFSTLAPLVLVAVGSAGAILAVLLTDGFAGGVTSTYVLILATKVALVATAALVGALARRHLRGSPSRRRMRRVFTIDALLLPMIVLASAALTQTGPHEGHAGQAGHAGHVDGKTIGTTRCAIEAGRASLSVVASPAHPGVNLLRIDGVPASALEVELRMTHAATSVAPIVLTATPDDGSWVADGVLPLEGPWQTTVAVRLDRFTQAEGECTLELPG